MFPRLKKFFSSLRVQLMASVFLWISPALVLTFIVNQDWFWSAAPEWLREYAMHVPWESLGVGFLALVAAWYGGERFILRQVHALTRAVLRLAGGDLQARSGLEQTEDEIGQLAQKFDEMAATLQQRQRERDEAERKLLNRAMQQTAVAAVGQCALTNRDLNIIYEQAVYRVVEMFGVEYAMLLQRLPDGRLHPLSLYGFKRPTPDQLMPPTGLRPDPMLWTADTGEVCVINDWGKETAYDPSPLLEELGVTSGVVVAIPTRGKPFGVLAAHTTNRRLFSPDDIQFLLSVANIVGMAVERIRAEEQTEKLAAFVKENPNAALEISAAGEVTYFNDAAGKLAAALGRNHPRDLLPENFPQIVLDCLNSGLIPERVPTKIDGHTVAWTFQPLPAAGVVHCHGEDITGRLSLEAQLLQSEKMKTFGQFAAGIAHDFNNMLTIIQGHAGKLLTAPSLPGEAQEALTQIYTAGDRAARLTRQLLLTSRKNVMQPRLLDLREIVGNTSKMLERLVGETIQLHFQCATALPLVHADQSMIEQVVMNLASNARDAMPAGGHLYVEMSETFVAPEHVLIHPEAVPGHYVKLEFTDTGSGMDEATLTRIFEPFFTTKDVGKGTGLGLATVMNIARQHGGWVEVTSRPGQGSTFTIYLPASAEAMVESNLVEISPIVPVTTGHETVLIVEDEEMLRDLAREILRDCGYRILEASTGRQALEIWDRCRDEIALLLTDMVMPEGVSGVDLAERLVTQNPFLKVVFMSGYTADNVNPELLERTNASFLQKPYGHAELAKVVRETLDKPVSSAAPADSAFKTAGPAE